MYFLDDTFYDRYQSGKREGKFCNRARVSSSKDKELPLPDGYCYKQKIAYINSETHDVAIKEEIFIEDNK